jgi:hypothetical protein
MSEAGDDDAARTAQAFRPNARPLVIAVLANALLAAVFLGLPYYLGRVQTERSLREFARFAGCLFGGKPQATLGLGLPAGERAHFAAQVMNAKLDWPTRCRASLQAVAPEEATFLWPSVKQAGMDVRAVVTLLDRELLELARARAAGATGRVPARPLLALAKLRGTLTLLARAGGVDDDIDANAVVFGPDADVIDPSRLPLVAGASAALDVRAGPDGLHAIAVDGSGVSLLRIDGGKVERSRVRRTSLVRAALRDGDRALLVWAMPEERCAQRDDRCVRRGTGVAHLEQDALQLPQPTWLAGHPGARPDRSVRPGLLGRVDLLARDTAEGALEVRRFDLAAQAATPAAPELETEASRPLAAVERLPVPAAQPPSDAQFVPGEPAAVAYAVPVAGAQGGAAEAGPGAAAEAGSDAAVPPSAQAFLWPYEASLPPVALGTVGGGTPWVEACEAQGVRWIAFGSDRELALARVAAGGVASTPLPATALDLGPLLPRDEARRDRVRLLCAAERATLVVLARDHTLRALRCDPGGCARSAALANTVTAFDAAIAPDENAVLAYARSDQPQVTVVRLDARAAPLGPPHTPAPCWDPQGGMCGQPTLVVAPSRLLLCARDGSDLVALESHDGGQRWKPLGGLKVGTAISTDANAPMQQHRIRKGLD